MFSRSQVKEAIGLKKRLTRSYHIQTYTPTPSHHRFIQFTPNVVIIPYWMKWKDLDLFITLTMILEESASSLHHSVWFAYNEGQLVPRDDDTTIAFKWMVQPLSLFSLLLTFTIFFNDRKWPTIFHWLCFIAGMEKPFRTVAIAPSYYSKQVNSSLSKCCDSTGNWRDFQEGRHN